MCDTPACHCSLSRGAKVGPDSRVEDRQGEPAHGYCRMTGTLQPAVLSSQLQPAARTRFGETLFDHHLVDADEEP
eukprot:CAMPEP_0181474304 /NCGR_PEP_ID=MMETSP1110-20121109/40580_1 /TAXON_ID=174948 /ORGANISM="Symbiodinium sp., Strain CCMP421" /LENGTH=74 /DNA_ID=CAMNT_0023599467 /DNA_START=35 /DNA_END=259 /DNA_ORIENTATION=-